MMKPIMTETSIKYNKTVIALGMFDGMHLGHRALIGRAAEIARREGLQSMVYTFENHPGALFGAAVPLLSTPDERREAMESMGIDRAEFAVFDRAMAEMSPAAFAAMLAERYRPHTLVAGFNYTFGHRAAGTVEDLRALGTRYGFAVHREEPVMDGGQPVSSTRIRAMLAEGDAEGAARLLGRPYGFTGPVVRCRHIGTSLGFPTANLAPPPGKLLPRPGVYVSRAVTPAGGISRRHQSRGQSHRRGQGDHHRDPYSRFSRGPLRKDPHGGIPRLSPPGTEIPLPGSSGGADREGCGGKPEGLGNASCIMHNYRTKRCCDPRLFQKEKWLMPQAWAFSS